MQQRNYKIDVLRGLSILFVILLHINIRVPFNQTVLGEFMPSTLYKLLFWSGLYGVEIFFVISGFLITSSIIAKNGSIVNVKPLQFYKMRFARIIPLLILLLTILSIFDLAGVQGFVVGGPSSDVTLGEAIFSALTFSINWLEMKVGYLPGAWDVLWSLSIEEVFYIVLPLICLLSKNQKTFIWVMIILALISPLFRNVWFVDSELGGRNNFACMGGMALGCLASMVVNQGLARGKLLIAINIIGWMLVLAPMLLRSTLYQLGVSKIGLNFTMLSIGVALLLICWQTDVNNGKNHRYKVLRMLANLGEHSYEIYLSHMFLVLGGVALFHSMERVGDWGVYSLYIVIVLASYFLGAVIAKFYTNPLNRYIRAKWFLKRPIVR